MARTTKDQKADTEQDDARKGEGTATDDAPTSSDGNAVEPSQTNAIKGQAASKPTKQAAPDQLKADAVAGSQADHENRRDAANAAGDEATASSESSESEAARAMTFAEYGEQIELGIALNSIVNAVRSITAAICLETTCEDTDTMVFHPVFAGEGTVSSVHVAMHNFVAANINAPAEALVIHARFQGHALPDWSELTPLQQRSVEMFKLLCVTVREVAKSAPPAA